MNLDMKVRTRTPQCVVRLALLFVNLNNMGYTMLSLKGKAKVKC
jgi:hypothetical protein